MNCQTDPVGSVMFVERNLRHQEALAKDAKDITSWNLSAPGFRIHTKGVKNHPNMDWPCLDLAREQPSALSFSLSSSLSPYFPDIRRVSRTLTEAQVKVITVLIMVIMVTMRNMIIMVTMMTKIIHH